MCQHRLYQASFLFRDYGFDLEEDALYPGRLSAAGQRPKQAWAQLNLLENPVEVSRADRALLFKHEQSHQSGSSMLARI
jgi:predicted DNA-binding helix-hairpin-helix protein